jgi:serralysin
MVDTISDDINTTAQMAIGDEFLGTIETNGDRDWIRIFLSPDVPIRINLTGDRNRGAELFDPILTIRDASGNAVATFDNTTLAIVNPAIGDGNAAASAYAEFTSFAGGEFYLEVSETNGRPVGDYLLSVYRDGLASGISTVAEIREGGQATGLLLANVPNLPDTEAYRISTEVGKFYNVVVCGQSNLTDYDLKILNSSGAAFAQAQLALFDIGVLQLTFQATDTTSFIQLSNLTDVGGGQYTIQFDEASPSDAIAANERLANVLKVHFVDGAGGANVAALGLSNGASFDPVKWLQAEQDTVVQAFATFSAFSNLSFSFVADPAQADLFLALGRNSDTASTDGFGLPGSGTVSLDGVARASSGVSVLNFQHPGWVTGRQLGGEGFHSILRQIGTLLGLEDPSFDARGSVVMQGVTSATAIGDFALNQGINTIMSRNPAVVKEAGQTQPVSFGQLAGPMALDITVLQAMYGTNLTANASADNYVLPTLNQLGQAFYQTIWDTGGTDTIIHDGTVAATIDLRAATLKYEDIGGGALSSVDGIDGGFTIAAGVLIENATGGSAGDILTGNAAANTLDGRGGADTMRGLEGNDTYIVDNSLDIVIETVAQGTLDTVLTTTSYALGAGSEIERLFANPSNSTLNINLIGNDFAQHLRGNDGINDLDGRGGADTMEGLDGNDRYRVDSSGDVVLEAIGKGDEDVVNSSVSYVLTPGQEIEILQTSSSKGSDPINLSGNAFGQKIVGNDGNNTLNGLGGTDLMFGRSGDDRYFVDSADDQVFERSDEGNDRVLASVSYLLAEFQEIEQLTTANAVGVEAINLTGNALGQLIQGNFGNNTLVGNGGPDTLQGFRGDDRYFVDSVDDIVIEFSNQGNDRVLSKVSYVLGTNVAVETLSTDNTAGTAAINLTGNALGQTIIGNNGSNALVGAGGPDTLSGLFGDDRYFVDSTDDIVIEAAGRGNDRVLSSVSYVLGAGVSAETLSTSNALGTLGIKLTGNEIAQLVQGNMGDNVLNGREGSDTLQGLGGSDIFLFNTTLGASNIDRILDFNVVDDTISMAQSILAGFGHTGAVLAQEFFASTLGIASSATHRFIYDTDDGKLFYDADGVGGVAAVQIANLSTGLAMTEADIFVI